MTFRKFTPGKSRITLEEMSELFGKKFIQHYDFLIKSYVGDMVSRNNFSIFEEKRIFIIIAEYDEVVARDDSTKMRCPGIRYKVTWAYPFLGYVDYMNPRVKSYRSDFRFDDSSVINSNGDGYIEFNLGFIERFEDGNLSSHYFDVFVKGMENIHGNKKEVFSNDQTGTTEVVGDIYSTMKVIKEINQIISDYIFYLDTKMNYGNAHYLK